MVMSCASNGLLCSDMGHRAPFEAVIRPRNATFRNHPTKTPNPGTCQCRLRNQAVLGLERSGKKWTCARAGIWFAQLLLVEYLSDQNAIADGRLG